MTLGKAIELLTLYEHAASSIPRDDFLDATKLGIEALKLYNRCRNTQPVWLPLLLPGETKE
ncbi:unnamed protein product [marine sediment metagenome]|uniref:Uncharacterized protein n=1 Tax=marine sediment metagenome TaxID=412755 RepID=X1R9L7_9ZZZZ